MGSGEIKDLFILFISPAISYSFHSNISNNMSYLKILKCFFFTYSSFECLMVCSNLKHTTTYEQECHSLLSNLNTRS